jgi:hypothetical protein
MHVKAIPSEKYCARAERKAMLQCFVLLFSNLGKLVNATFEGQGTLKRLLIS